jgi:hypothetical protein
MCGNDVWPPGAAGGRSGSLYVEIPSLLLSSSPLLFSSLPNQDLISNPPADESKE